MPDPNDAREYIRKIMEGSKPYDTDTCPDTDILAQYAEESCPRVFVSHAAYKAWQKHQLPSDLSEHVQAHVLFCDRCCKDVVLMQRAFREQYAVPVPGTPEFEQLRKGQRSDGEIEEPESSGDESTVKFTRKD